MIPGKTLEPKDLLNILRRRWAIFIPFALIALGTAVVVYMLPNQYRSETLIMVVPQRVPESYVKSTVTTKIEDRLRSINQQITSRTRLEPVVKEFGLYPALVRTGLMEDVIERMRQDIQIQIIRGDAFRISYVSDDARTAMKVTERLASMYIDESLRDREMLAESTNQFLDSQLAAAKQRLVEHEQKLEEYKTRFSGRLPAQVPANLQVMQNLQLQIQSVVDSLNRDRDRRLVLEGQLAELGVSTPSQPEAEQPAPKPVVGPNASALAEARKGLNELRQRLTPSHPDVVRQQRIIADLEKKAADETTVVALLTPETRPAASADGGEITRLTRIAQIRTEIESLNRQISRKEEDESRLRATVGDYQTRVEAAPTREAELTELMRDYDTLQLSYTTLLAKKEDAQVSANLERHQIGEQFKILDPARMPEKPFRPNRPLFYGLGAAAGLGAGLLLAGFLEYRDASLKSAEDVVATLTLPVLAMIPELMTTDFHRLRTRRRRTAWGLMAGATFLAAIVVMVWVSRG